MADLLIPIRATDGNNDPVPSAQMFVYQTGTDTAQVVYSDQAATTPHVSPIVADDDGVFPVVFVTASVNLKIDINDPVTGASLPGYPLDPAPVLSLSSGGASDITFAPTDEITSTNAQAAIVEVRADIVGAKTGEDAGFVSGTAGSDGNIVTWNDDGDAVDSGKSFSGSDDTAITGAAGTDGQLVVWNGDGDVVGDTAEGAVRDAWGLDTYGATTSGTEVDFVIPSGAREIEIVMNAVSMSAGGDIEIQLGTGGVATTTGYVGGGTSTGSFTSSFGIDVGGASNSVYGIIRLRRATGNTWVCDYAASLPGSERVGAGGVTIAGEVDLLSFGASGGNVFDAGGVLVRAR